LDKSRVIRIIIEYGPPYFKSFIVILIDINRNGRAVGVEYIKENDETASGIVVKASRLVVVSAGAFGSPTILERSGVGSKRVLDRNGITQIVDLPGVGEQYTGYYTYTFGGSRTNIFLDHLFSSSFYYGSDETESLDSLLRGDEANGL